MRERSFRMIAKKLMSWLLYDFITKYRSEEMSFYIQFVERNVVVARQKMYIVPQIGSKVEVREKFFIVKDVIYSPYGLANKLIGEFV